MKNTIIALMILTATSSFLNATTNVYRYYNPSTGNHASATLGAPSGFVLEGKVYETYAYQAGLIERAIYSLRKSGDYMTSHSPSESGYSTNYFMGHLANHTWFPFHSKEVQRWYKSSNHDHIDRSDGENLSAAGYVYDAYLGAWDPYNI